MPDTTTVTTHRLRRLPTVSPRGLRTATSVALAASVLIVITGGVVRVTASRLGCSTWPVCEPGSFTPTGALGVHGVIGFSNRVLTGVLCAAVAGVILTAALQHRRDRPVVRLAVAQLALIIGNAVAGGITVWTGLNPYVAAVHFLMAIGLLTTTALTWHRTRTITEPGPRFTPIAVQKAFSETLLVFTAALIGIGTLVSGSGPHSGAADATARIPVPWIAVTLLHGVLGTATLLLTIGLLLRLRTVPAARTPLRRTRVFLIVLMAQALLGVVQSATGLPDTLVVLHLLGAALVWVGVLRVYRGDGGRSTTFCSISRGCCYGFVSRRRAPSA